MLPFLSLALSLLPQAGAQQTENAELRHLVRDAGRLVHWIRDPYARLDTRRRAGAAQPYTPPLDRNALLDFALKRAKTEGRIVLAYVWRIEGRPMYRAPVLDDYARLALWSDPELIDLVNRKFVPLRLYAAKDVAKRLGLYNADPKDPLFLEALEPALVFLSPGGEILHRIDRIRTFSASWLRNVLESLLAKHAAFGGPSLATRLARTEGVEDPRAQVWLAREQIKDGDEALALKTLTGASSAVLAHTAKLRTAAKALEAKKPADGAPELRSWTRALARLNASIEEAQRASADVQLMRAKALRLSRQPKLGLGALISGIEMLGTSASTRPALWLEAARCHIALGDYVEAGRSLAAAGKSSEAEWLRGALAWQRFDLGKARGHFRAAIAAGEAPWTHRAAAMLAIADDTTPFSPLAHGYEVLGDVAAGAYVAGRLPRTTELMRRGSPLEAKAGIVRAAVRYLLAQQRPDGRWADARYAYWPSPEIVPNVHVAVTALAATALMAWRDLDPERIDAALAKAEAFLKDDGHLNLGTEEEVYSQAYRILYWTRKQKSAFGTRGDNFANLDKLIKRAREIQDPKTGFFAHEYKNAFCTGAMMWSVYLAKSIGVEIDDDLVALGVRALRSARRKDGSFSYGGTASDRDTRRGDRDSITNLKNASARMPVCEAVLHAFGAAERATVTKAFETFLKYLDRIARVRKTDFHSDGQLAGFFFWHAMFHASEAKAVLEKGLRERVERRLLDLITGFPEIDGSFVDSHELGKSYGTAMALLTLKNLPSLK